MPQDALQGFRKKGSFFLPARPGHAKVQIKSIQQILLVVLATESGIQIIALQQHVAKKNMETTVTRLDAPKSQK